ncbi:MAG: alpha/beta fold hydrolase [Planctomycetes bacterium]|nr:alpha/beta fold hydrolase [Planctomycetota bacterium]
MKPDRALLVAFVVAVLSSPSSAQEGEKPVSLQDARRDFKTRLVRTERDKEPLPEPADPRFSLVKYRGPLGDMAAWLSKAPEPGKKFPAIVWITGGLPPGGIDESAWEPAPADNDQSAKAYRLAGIVMMYPALRGSGGNPGAQESFFGEVDDVLAAAEHLRGVPYVDPAQVYVGGHSTGGTLALLVAAAADPERIRAVFAFGPLGNPADYGAESLTYDPADEKENRLRSPIRFLGAIRTPTFVIEGSRGNFIPLLSLKSANKNPAVRILEVKNADHFQLLTPVNKLIAKKIASKAPDSAVDLKADELQSVFDAHQVAQREAGDLATLAAMRRNGVDLAQPQPVRYFLYADHRKPLEDAAASAKQQGFDPGEIKEHKGEEGDVYHELILRKRMTLRDLDSVFGASAALSRIAREKNVDYDGWEVGE